MEHDLAAKVRLRLRCPRAALAAAARPRRGTAMAEAALALVPVLMVFVGLVQFALWAHKQNVVTGAAQDGARVAAAEGAGALDGAAHADRLLASGLGDGADAFDVSASEDPLARSVTVHVRGTMPTVIPWANNSTLMLEARATVSKEGFRPQGGAGR